MDLPWISHGVHTRAVAICDRGVSPVTLPTSPTQLPHAPCGSRVLVDAASRSLLPPATLLIAHLPTTIWHTLPHR